jgi:ABC-type multidrug transport system ATPase subunit
VNFAGRKILKERLGGQILVNGYPKVQSDFAHVMGYVDKIDAYSPYMTVKEILIYSTTMRLGKLASKQNKMKFVEEVICLAFSTRVALFIQKYCSIIEC